MARRRADRAGPVDDRAVAARGCVLRGDRFDRRQGAQRGRAPGRRRAGVDHGRRRSQSQHTTAEGCAFFAFLTPGAYTVTVTAGTGVGDQEVLIPSQATSVTVGQTASLTFNYDTAATITITGWSGSTATPGDQHPDRDRRTPASSRTASTRTRPGTTTLTPLFPYPAGYTVFAGNCTDNNPNGLDTTHNRFYNNPGTSTVTVTPGGSDDRDGAALRPADHRRELASARRSSARRSPRPRRRDTRPVAATPPVCTNGGGVGQLPTHRSRDVRRGRHQPHRRAARALDDQRDRRAPSTARVKIWRRITGVFNVTATGASTGSALSDRHGDGQLIARLRAAGVRRPAPSRATRSSRR